MNVIILGCGRIGSTLARSFDRDGHSVTVIDQKTDALKRLGSDFNGITVVGNGIDQEVLKKAGIEKADAFVAVTNGDNTNIMSVQIAKVRFKVDKVITKISDPIRACAYRDAGIETICPTIIGSRLIKDYLISKEWGLAADYCALDDDEVLV